MKGLAGARARARAIAMAAGFGLRPPFNIPVTDAKRKDNVTQ